MQRDPRRGRERRGSRARRRKRQLRMNIKKYLHLYFNIPLFAFLSCTHTYKPPLPLVTCPLPVFGIEKRQQQQLKMVAEASHLSRDLPLELEEVAASKRQQKRAIHKTNKGGMQLATLSGMLQHDTFSKEINVTFLSIVKPTNNLTPTLTHFVRFAFEMKKDIRKRVRVEKNVILFS